MTQLLHYLGQYTLLLSRFFRSVFQAFIAGDLINATFMHCANLGHWRN